MKTCPECAEEVKDAALVCRFCGFRFDSSESQAEVVAAAAPPAAAPVHRPFGVGKIALGVFLGLVLTAVVVGGVMIVAPAFSGDRDLNYDKVARSNANLRNSEIEGCWVETEDYTKCGESQIGSKVPDGERGSGEGQVEVAETGSQTFRIVAHSESGNTFTLERTSDSEIARDCESAGKAGCSPGGQWR